MNRIKNRKLKEGGRDEKNTDLLTSDLIYPERNLMRSMRKLLPVCHLSLQHDYYGTETEILKAHQYAGRPELPLVV